VDSWKPVERDKPEILGINKRDRSLIDVQVRLSTSHLPNDWNQFFLKPVGLRTPSSLRSLALLGDKGLILFEAPDDQIEAYIGHVDERISSANRRYETEVIPKFRAIEEANQKTQRWEDERLRVARERVEKL
jgi:hypothetical protein